MKKLALASATILSFASGSYATLDTVNKSGFYIGVNGGYGFGKDKMKGADVNIRSKKMKGPIGGGHFGYQHDMGRFVVGLELGADFPKMHRSFKTEEEIEKVSSESKKPLTPRERTNLARGIETLSRSLVSAEDKLEDLRQDHRGIAEEVSYNKRSIEALQESQKVTDAAYNTTQTLIQQLAGKQSRLNEDATNIAAQSNANDKNDSSSKEFKEHFEGKVVRKHGYTAALRFGYKVAPCWVAGLSLGYAYAQHALKGTRYIEEVASKKRVAEPVNQKFKNHGFIPGVYVEKLLQKHVMVGLAYNYGLFKKHKSKKHDLIIKPQTHDVKIRLGYKF